MKYFALYAILFLIFIWTLIGLGDYTVLFAALGSLTFMLYMWGLSYSFDWVSRWTNRTIPRSNGAQVVHIVLGFGGYWLFLNYVQNRAPLLNIVALMGFVYLGNFAALLLFGVRKQEPDSL